MTMPFQPNQQPPARILVICDQSDTAPIWGYIIREKGLIAILETSPQRALARLVDIHPDMIIVDINSTHTERLTLCQAFREQSNSLLLLFLPASNETEILEAYQAGVDECVIKPVSPAVFLAKILAWVRRGRLDAPGSASPVHPAALRLDPVRRLGTTRDGRAIKLTNLEYRLLRLLTNRPGTIFPAEEIIQSVWGMHGENDAALLKNVIYRLRKKMETDGGETIQTWPGGYSYQED